VLEETKGPEDFAGHKSSLGLAEILAEEPVGSSLHGSFAQQRRDALRGWIPNAIEFTFVGKCEGPKVSALVPLAEGKPRVLWLVETSEGTICGGFYAPMPIVGGWAEDDAKQTFIFSLRSSEGAKPMKFPLLVPKHSMSAQTSRRSRSATAQT
jgi:hypothetical protein